MKRKSITAIREQNNFDRRVADLNNALSKMMKAGKSSEEMAAYINETLRLDYPYVPEVSKQLTVGNLPSKPLPPPAPADLKDVGRHPAGKTR
jgi:hypothetical protein